MPAEQFSRGGCTGPRIDAVESERMRISARLSRDATHQRLGFWAPSISAHQKDGITMNYEEPNQPTAGSTQDRAGDLTALILDHPVAALSALRRSMLNWHASASSRITAARAILDIALRRAEDEIRAVPRKAAMHTGERLLKNVNEARRRLAEKCQGGLQGQHPGLSAEEQPKPAKNPPPTEPGPSSRYPTGQVIMEYVPAALSVLRGAMFDGQASQATRTAAARTILDFETRAEEIERRKAQHPRYKEDKRLLASVNAARERLAKRREEERQKLLQQTRKNSSNVI
jgi:hypothetical protein